MEPNILLIMCDTLRSDVLSLYGGPAKTPNLNKLAKDSMVYKNGIASSSWTFPSHVSLFTGAYLKDHGIHESGRLYGSEPELYKELVTGIMSLKTKQFQSYLKENGYSCYGISNNPYVSPFSGFGKDFDWFFYLDLIPREISEEYVKAYKHGATVSQIAFELIKEGMMYDIIKYAKLKNDLDSIRKSLNYPIDKGARITNNILLNSKFKSKFFLFLNLMEVHNPYVGEKRIEIENNFAGFKDINEGVVRNLKNQYIYETEYLDKKIGEILQMFKDKGLYDEMMIILTSDHGQAFNEHGFMYHGTYLYDELVRVPMIIKYPKNKKFQKQKGYQSISSINALVKGTIEGSHDEGLTTEVAFAEAYGTNQALLPYQLKRKKYIEEKHNKLRRAVYKGEYKLTINGTDGIVEEFLKNGKSINPAKTENKKAFDLLVGELAEFSKGDKFILPG